MSLTKEAKGEIVKRFGESESDTGSAEVQIAMLTERINQLDRASAHARARITTPGVGCSSSSGSAGAC